MKKTLDKVPENVSNPTLYRSIRNRMRAEHKAQSKRWGAYSSGQLVQEYKRRGGKYKPSNSKQSRSKRHNSKQSRSKRHNSKQSRSKLARWYREKWVDACAYANGKIKSCGRKSVDSGKFPYCRPLHRITSKTPKTVKELSLTQIKKLCTKKRKNPKKIIHHKSVSKRPKSRRKYSINSTKQHIKLLNIKKSPKSDKKLRATFEVTSSGKTRIRNTDFGAAGMSDYTKHKDRERRGRYIDRHTKDLRTNDPTRAGYLSMYVLWNKPSLKTSIDDYKKRLAKYNKTGNFPKHIK